MMIIGCDLHTRYQQIAMLDTETGELVERRLEYESGEARAFYAGLSGEVRVGIEATGHTHWFEALLARARARVVDGRCGEDSGVGDRKQKTDARGRGAFAESVARGAISPDLGGRRRRGEIYGNWDLGKEFCESPRAYHFRSFPTDTIDTVFPGIAAN
jgi:hypothetical protein